MKTNISRKIRKISFILALFLVSLTGGVALDRLVLANAWPLAEIPAEAKPDFKLMAEAWHLIDSRYVDQQAVDNTTMAYGAIGGMVDVLGDSGHSRFLSPEMVQAQEKFNQGAFEGIGAYVEMRDGQVVIVAAIDNSPAQAAGLLPGDVIVAVDGQDVTSGLSLAQVTERILGPAGTPVTLVVLDPPDGKRRELTLVRAKVTLQNVTWQQLPGTGVAHVRIAAFSQGVTDALRQALLEIEAQGLTGIILDLRGNPGGLLSEAIGVASQFLKPDQAVLLRQRANGEVKTEMAQTGGVAQQIPLVILVNQGSASASEIVAGSLQDAGRGQLVGETTFGTGTVLDEFKLSDGSALLLATEEWLTPKGRLIWHQGIKPDVAVEMANSASPLLPETERQLTAEALQGSDDVQLRQALSILETAADVAYSSPPVQP